MGSPPGPHPGLRVVFGSAEVQLEILSGAEIAASPGKNDDAGLVVHLGPIERVNHVHAKDVRPDILERARKERWSFLDSVVNGVYTVPGDGFIDFEASFKPLAEAGYSGWMICEAEQDPAKAHPLTYAKKGYAHLRAAAEKAGFKIA